MGVELFMVMLYRKDAKAQNIDATGPLPPLQGEGRGEVIAKMESLTWSSPA